MSARGKIVSLYIPSNSSGTYILPLSPITGSHTVEQLITSYPLLHIFKKRIKALAIGIVHSEVQKA